MNRREFLRLGAAAALTPLTAQDHDPPIAVPRVNGGIVVSPLRRFDQNAGTAPPIIVPRLVEVQLKRVYELGFRWMRVMISFERFGPNFLAAIPYVRAARALGIDVLGIMGQFAGAELFRAISDPATRDAVFETYTRIFGDFVLEASDAVPRTGELAFQIMNEPTHFHGVSPQTYVRDFLRPAYLHLKEDDPSLVIVSAAPVSSAEGFLRAQAMIETGMEHVCDRVAFHIYDTRFLERLARFTDKPVWITESGARGRDRHLEWMTSTFDAIRTAIPNVEEIFWFGLYDMEPDGFRLYDIVPDPVTGFESVPDSTEAIEWLSARVHEASGGRPLVSYEELIPNIQLYMPTEEDLRMIEATGISRD